MLWCSSNLRDRLEPRARGPGRIPHLEAAGKFDPFDLALRLALEASHQEAPGGGSEIVDRLSDGGQIGTERRHPVEIVEADNRHVAGDFEAETVRGLDRGQSANVGEGENRRRPISAVELEFDRAALAFEIMAPVNNAVAPIESCLAESAPTTDDALLNVVETLRMGKNGNVAVSEVDEVARRRIAASDAIGAHRVESRRVRPAVDQHRWGHAGTVSAALERRHRIIGRRDDDQPVDAASDERLDTAALVRGVLARRDDEEIVAVAFRKRLDSVHEAGEEDIGDVGDDHPDEASRPAAKGAGRTVKPIIERRDRFEHLAAARLPDRTDAIDDIGGGRDRNPRAERDIANGGRSPHRPSPPGVADNRAGSLPASL